MSCHYSCSTCITPIFADQCLSCPSTRQLVDTTCLCISSYYQYQQTNCLTSDQISKPDYTFYTMVQILYWIMLGFSWLMILGNMNHLYSAKIRVIIGWAQLMSLLLEYRFRFTVLSQQALKVFSVWNFRYFDNLLCTQKSKPYQCQTYQNVYGPLFTLGAFFIAMLVSFILIKTCVSSIFTQQNNSVSQKQGGGVVIINNNNEEYKSQVKDSIRSMTFSEYIKISIKQIIFLYLDYTIVQWTVQISRIAYVNNNLFLLYIPIIIFLILYSLYALKVINSISQFKIQYRSQLGYFYLYDQKYYLNYLDYLFQQEQQAKQYPKYYQPQRYYPHSNYLIIQLAIKFFIASTTIIMFQYKPQLWVFPCLFLLFVCFIKLKVFMIYERLALLCYMLGFVVYLLSVALFFFGYFFNIWIIFLALITTAAFIVLLISDLSDWTRAKQGKYWAVAFQYLNGVTDDEQQRIQPNQQPEQQNQFKTQQENSHNDLVKSINSGVNDVIKSRQDTRQKSDQQLNNLARNILVNTRPSFKKNVSSSQKNSITNKNIDANLSVNNEPNQIDNQPQQNRLQSPYQQSFMSRTNRSKFGGTVSKDSLDNSKSKFKGSFRPQNEQKRGLPQIIEEDKMESVDEQKSNVFLNNKRPGGENGSEDNLNNEYGQGNDSDIDKKLDKIHGTALQRKGQQSKINNSIGFRRPKPYRR